MTGTWSSDTRCGDEALLWCPTDSGNGNSFPHDLLSSAAAHTSSRFLLHLPEEEKIARCEWHCPLSPGTPLCFCLQFVFTQGLCVQGGGGWWLCPVSLTRPLLHWVRLCATVGFPHLWGEKIKPFAILCFCLFLSLSCLSPLTRSG